MWTRFMDMHSGGSQKEDKQYIYIETSQELAELIFYNRFGHNPRRVSCTCCGEDYSISEYPSLAEATGYNRNCEYKDGKWLDNPAPKGKGQIFGNQAYQTVDEYVKNPNVMIIYSGNIAESERMGTIPEQGYVWRD